MLQNTSEVDSDDIVGFEEEEQPRGDNNPEASQSEPVSGQTAANDGQQASGHEDESKREEDKQDEEDKEASDESIHRVEEIFVCQICCTQFGDTNGTEDQPGQKPYMLKCGHTLCLKCLKTMLQKNVRRSDVREIQCPFDKSKHRITTSIEKDLPVNYSILRGLSALNSKRTITEFLAKPVQKFCGKKGHLGEQLNFYCKGHKQLICQVCLLQEDHLVQKCDIISSKAYIWEQNYKDEAQKCKAKISEYVEDLSL